MARSPFLTIEETEPGSSTYVLSSDDFDLYAPSFQKCDQDGGGYDWESVAVLLLRSMPRGSAKAISFDSEAGMFCALSRKRPALEQFAEALCHTFRSKQRLLAAITEADSLASARPHKPSKLDTVVAIHFNRYLHDDKEPLVDALTTALPKKNRLVYHPSGAGEVTLYLRTNDADDAISVITPILQAQKLLKSAIIAVAPRDSIEYVVVHPQKRKKPLVPFNELCPTIP